MKYPPQYKIILRTDDPTTIQLTNHNFTPKDRPLPDPVLLALHAACAQVAHLPGVAEYFDQCEREGEDTLVLAEDVSSFRGLCGNDVMPHGGNFWEQLCGDPRCKPSFVLVNIYIYIFHFVYFARLLL